LSYESDIRCHVEIDGQRETIEAQIRQEYLKETAEISISFEWPNLLTGFPEIKVSDRGYPPSVQMTSGILVKSHGNTSSNGIISPTRITASATLLDIYHSTTPTSNQLVDLHFYLANFPNFVRPNPFQVNIGGLSIDFQYISEGHINQRVVISGIEFSRLHEATELVNDCCWLCSVAAGCYVTIPRFEVCCNSCIVLTKLRNVDMSMSDVGKPLVHDRLSYQPLKEFIENTHSLFCDRKIDYSLCLLIHLGLLAKHHQYLQARALLMSDFLEVLRDRYATSICVPKGIMEKQGFNFYWRIPPKSRIQKRRFMKRLCNLLTGKSQNRFKVSFREIIDEFCNEHRLSGFDADFIKLRNEIMHTGDIGSLNKMAHYLAMHHFCDRSLLALLDWDKHNGRYLPIHNPSNLTTTSVSPN
jgi:hypothetical protein